MGRAPRCMQLILRSKDRGHLGQFSATRAWLCLGIAAIALGTLTFRTGHRTAEAFGVRNAEARVAEWEAELERQWDLLASTRAELQQDLDVLALRTGRMNAHVVRLDALGARLTRMAGLEDGEFDFSTAPLLDGPEALVLGADDDPLDGVVEALDRIDLQLSDRSRKLDVLEELLLNCKPAKSCATDGRSIR